MTDKQLSAGGHLLEQQHKNAVHTIGKVATQLLLLLRDGARYKWITADPQRCTVLENYSGRDELDHYIDAKGAKDSGKS